MVVLNNHSLLGSRSRHCYAIKCFFAIKLFRFVLSGLFAQGMPKGVANLKVGKTRTPFDSPKSLRPLFALRNDVGGIRIEIVQGFVTNRFQSFPPRFP